MTPGGFAPAAVLAAALAARHAAQLLLTRGGARGARSGLVSTGLLFVCYVSAMALALWRLARGGAPVGAVAAGAGTWLAAVALRMWALAHLRGQFSSFIEIREGHRLVTSGPYAFVRHPLHLAFGLEVAAFGLLAWAPEAAVPAVAVWAVILVRNRTEEAVLAGHFGAAYESYRSRVPALLPGRALLRLLGGTKRADPPQETHLPGR